jgi:hypothetical protein
MLPPATLIWGWGVNFKIPPKSTLHYLSNMYQSSFEYMQALKVNQEDGYYGTPDINILGIQCSYLLAILSGATIYKQLIVTVWQLGKYS